MFNALRRKTPAVRTGSVCRLLIKEKSKSHEVDFVAGDALLMRAYSLIQVSADMAREKTREREIAALDASMAQFDLGESAIVTMDEQTDISCEHGVVHVVPAWKWLLPNHLWTCGVRTSRLPHHGWGAPCCAKASPGF